MTEAQVREMENMVNELMDIGRGEGFLSLAAGGGFNERKRYIRAIEIGKRLNEIGGMDAMRMGGMAVSRFLDSTKGRELEACWDGIGAWRG